MNPIVVIAVFALVFKVKIHFLIKNNIIYFVSIFILYTLYFIKYRFKQSLELPEVNVIAFKVF